ncbi:ubiquinone/menaquinone biosynthesis methyltransferase [Pirellula sp. SH-Sr6A]|uniref:class I SAM-dependent methyltransferase n=1 Tax=Pirellula sp. SH-Sr6A TaxID=1632865 RepID=UPI00078DF524|nr:methyltransferase domain-containing protein [Pirellula sp. SH-Sr6A]AMV33038.1 ubiquinone/menaquinone biosynthesis methyltransferase [Pirellula sp. SH-Sr6A]
MSLSFDETNRRTEAESINAEAYNRMARAGHVLATPVRDEELANPLAVVDGRGWLGGSIHGWNVLCLAAGGGRHSALYAAAGAKVTVVDISEGMLELDRVVCHRHRFDVRLIQGSMVSMPMLRDNEFDLVVHPVSTCYVQNIRSVFLEVARVLRGGGLYVSQHKSPFNLQTSLSTDRGRYWIETEVEAVAKKLEPGQISSLRESHSQEYAHSLESILGGICRSGMLIEDLSEPEHANPSAAPDTPSHRARFVPPYIRIKARRAKPSGLVLGR